MPQAILQAGADRSWRAKAGNIVLPGRPVASRQSPSSPFSAPPIISASFYNLHPDVTNLLPIASPFSHLHRA